MSAGIVVLVTGGPDFGEAERTDGMSREYREVVAERRLAYRTLADLHADGAATKGLRGDEGRAWARRIMREIAAHLGSRQPDSSSPAAREG